MQAVVLAGGKGTRLRPYTVVFPKPLMPIGDYPILEVIVRQLKASGFDNLVFTVGHQHEMFRTFFEDGSKWNVKIDYSLEDKPLGTAAPIALVENLEKDFLMINGDILTDLDFAQAMDFHKSHGNPVTIVTHNRTVDINYGTLEINDRGELETYTEKPTLSYNVSMGIYFISRSVVDLIPKGAYFDFPDLVNKLLAAGRKVICYPYDGYWLDIGRPDDYLTAIDEFEKRKDTLLK